MTRSCDRRQKGTSILETMIAIIVICWIFFGMMQMFHWSIAKMFCDYASFYAAKAQSLGYAKRTIDKAARVAAVGVSGSDLSSPKLFSGINLGDRFAMYMSTGNSNLDFSYWDPSGSGEPEFQVRLANYGAYTANTRVEAKASIYNMPMLDETWASFLQIGTDKITPHGESAMYNYAHDILK